MPQGPLFGFRAPGPKDAMIRFIVEDLACLRGFARRLIAPGLAPVLDEMDLLQECFLCAQSKLKDLQGMDPSGLREWLRRHLRQIVRDHRRSRKREEERLQRIARNVELVVPEDYELRLGWLGVVLHRLDRTDALLVVLVLIKGRPICEAAEKVGLSRCAAWRRLSELKRMIREFLRSETAHVVR